jgi:hypothetical protein
MLAEFVHGLKPKETFASFGDQAVPRRAFYHLKKVRCSLVFADFIDSKRPPGFLPFHL